nr:Putative DNA-binding domain [uncultured Mediterranean phage uvMED]
MVKTRGFLQLTYVLYHHLDKVSGGKKANCLSVYLSLMKYCWKSNNYTAGLRHSTIQKDTGLSRTTIHRTLLTLTKLNIISTSKGKSGKTYIVNPNFVKFEKSMYKNETYNPSNVSDLKTLEEQYIYTVVDKMISKNKGNFENIINDLATLPADTLKMDKNNVYYCKLAIQRKEEMARQKNLVDPRIIARELKKISKETNVRYKEKRDFNIRNNIKPWEK